MATAWIVVEVVRIKQGCEVASEVVNRRLKSRSGPTTLQLPPFYLPNTGVASNDIFVFRIDRPSLREHSVRNKNRRDKVVWLPLTVETRKHQILRFITTTYFVHKHLLFLRGTCRAPTVLKHPRGLVWVAAVNMFPKQQKRGFFPKVSARLGQDPKELEVSSMLWSLMNGRRLISLKGGI